MKVFKKKLRKIIRESFIVSSDVMSMYTDYLEAVNSGDKETEERISNHFKSVIAVLDKFDNVDGDKEKEGSDEFSVQAFRNMIKRSGGVGGSNERKTAKITERQLRKIIREKFAREDFRDVYATAQMAHVGQKRRSGEDYFSHPSEVRNIVRRFYPKDRVSELAALLHDSLEDAPGSTVDSPEEMEEFIRGSITDPASGDEVIRVVRALTHEKGGDYQSYVIDLMNDQPALRVKLADMVHNLSSSPSPKQKLKYKSALDAIGAQTNGQPPAGISQKHWGELQALTESKQMKITKRQLVRIIREMNSSPGVHFDITKDIALQSDGLGTTDTITRDDFYDMISDYYKEQEGIRFRNFEMLDKMNIQQVAEFYDDMFPQSALRESQDPSLLPSALEAINNGTASATMGMGLGKDEILISFGQGQSVVLKLRSF